MSADDSRMTRVTLISRSSALRVRAAAALADGVELRLVAGLRSGQRAGGPGAGSDVVLVEAGWPEGRQLAERIAGDATIVGVEPDAMLPALLSRGAAMALRVSAIARAFADGDPSDADVAFLVRVESAIDSGMSRPDFNVTELAEAIGLSPRQLLRTVHRLTGQTVSQRIRNHRLETARHLLERGSYETVAQVAAQVGMTPSYLARAFAQSYGVQPSTMLRDTQSPGERPR